MRYDNPEPGKYRLIVRAVEGGEEKALTSGPASQSLYQPSWSPDGKTIVCVMVDTENVAEDLVGVDSVSGARKIFFSSRDRQFEKPSWLPDGTGLLGQVREESSNFTRTQIGFISYPQGKYSPVTRDTNSYSDLSVAGTGHILATVQNEFHWNLQVMPVAQPDAEPRQITSSDADSSFTWTRENQLISDQANVLNWIDPATGNKTVIPAQAGVSGAPWACGDGDSIVFIKFNNGGGAQHVWRMDATGNNFKQVTSGKLDTYPVCTQDGKWVFFIKQGGDQILAKVSIDGGTPQVISEKPVSGSFDVSPDGKIAAFPTLEHSGEHKEKLAIVETDAGKVIKIADFERPRFGLLHFSRDGKAVVYPVRAAGVDNLFEQPLDGSKGKQITNFKIGAHLRFSLVLRWQATGAGPRPHRRRCSADRRHEKLSDCVIR